MEGECWDCLISWIDGPDKLHSIDLCTQKETQGQETRQLRELLWRFIPRLFGVIPRQISTKNFGVVIYERNRSSRPLCETTSSSWTSNEEISSYVLQSGNPCWIGSLCPFFDFSKWTRSLPIRWFMVQFELPGRRMEHTIFRMSSKETANELWGQGFCARVLGVQQRVLSTWEDDTGVSTPCGRLSWLLFPNFSQRFSILSYNQKTLLRWVVSYLEHEPRRPHSPQDTCWLSMTTIGPRGYWCPYTNH